MATEKMEDKYQEGNLKEYQHWTLTISFRQTTLGCYIILAKRPIERITELNDKELIELRQVMQTMENALTQAEHFKPDRFNYLQLGNSLHRLHFHGIPRYSSPRNFAGQEWIDTQYGTTPVIVSKENESEVATVRTIREALQLFIN